MIKDVLIGVGGIGLLGMVSLAMFFGVFLGTTFWVLRLRRPYVQHMSRLPLEDEAPQGDPQ